jgi:hypothetical protein
MNNALKIRVSILLGCAVLLQATQFFYYNFLVMIVAMILLIIAFFSLTKAESRPYNPKDDKKLFFIPALIGLVCIAIGAWLMDSFLLAGAIAFVAHGIYAVIKRETVLSFGGYRVYQGFFAAFAGLVFVVLGGFMILIDLFGDSSQNFSEPSGKWIGQYESTRTMTEDCESYHMINVKSAEGRKTYAFGQYPVQVSSQVTCLSEEVAGVPQYDDIVAYAAEEGDKLVIWEATATKDTLLIFQRIGDGLRMTSLDERIQLTDAALVRRQ